MRVVTTVQFVDGRRKNGAWMEGYVLTETGVLQPGIDFITSIDRPAPLVPRV